MRLRFRLPRFVLSALLGVLSFLPNSASAQSATQAPPPPARLRFLFLDEGPGRYELKIDKNTFRQVSGGPYEISAPHSPADARPLEIYKASMSPDPVTGQIPRLKVATFAPPANTPSVLVIVSPRPAVDPAAPPVYKVDVIDCNPADFPGQSIRIINLGKVAMAAQFGAQRMVTEPGATDVLRLKTDSRSRVFFKIAVQSGQNPPAWKLLQDSITVVRPKERVLGLLVYSPSGMKHMLTPTELAELGPPPPGHFWLTFSDTP